MSDADPAPSKNLARQITPRWARVAREAVAAAPKSLGEMLRLVRHLFNGIWGEDLALEKRQQLLYSFGPWDEAKIAVLDAGWTALPRDRLPQSEADLNILCNQLLDRTGDFDLRYRFVKGWSKDELPGPALSAFCSKLWQTSRNDPKFYEAVVCGNHGSAVRYLVDKQMPMGLKKEQALQLIFRMALIWCAHDVQATAARARVAMTKPFGWLHMGPAKRMMADTVFSIWRPAYDRMGLNKARYRSNAEARAGKAEGKPTRHYEVKLIKDEVEASLKQTLLRKSTRRERDGAMDDMSQFIAMEEDGYWDELASPSGRYRGKQQSQVWYYDLTPHQMMAVAIIGLINAEASLESQLSKALELARAGRPLPFDFFSFREKHLKRGWKLRTRLLVDALGKTILQAKDPEGDNEEGTGAKFRFETYIQPALDFLKRATSKPLPKSVELISDDQRTLLLLSVALDIRFSR